MWYVGLDWAPYRILCNGVKREGVKASPALASGFSVIHRCTKFGMASEANSMGALGKGAWRYCRSPLLLTTGYFTGRKSQASDDI
jgi:hypothetical protein